MRETFPLYSTVGILPFWFLFLFSHDFTWVFLAPAQLSVPCNRSTVVASVTPQWLGTGCFQVLGYPVFSPSVLLTSLSVHPYLAPFMAVPTLTLARAPRSSFLLQWGQSRRAGIPLDSLPLNPQAFTVPACSLHLR